MKHLTVYCKHIQLIYISIQFSSWKQSNKAYIFQRSTSLIKRPEVKISTRLSSIHWIQVLPGIARHLIVGWKNLYMAKVRIRTSWLIRGNSAFTSTNFLSNSNIIITQCCSSASFVAGLWQENESLHYSWAAHEGNRVPWCAAVKSCYGLKLEQERYKSWLYQLRTTVRFNRLCIIELHASLFELDTR